MSRLTAILTIAMVLAAFANVADPDETASEPTTTDAPADPEPTTTRPPEDGAEGFADEEVVGSEACRRVEDTLAELEQDVAEGRSSAALPELFAADLDVAQGAATQYGYVDLAESLTEVVEELRTNGFTASAAGMLAGLKVDCGIT